MSNPDPGNPPDKGTRATDGNNGLIRPHYLSQECRRE